MEMWLFAFSDRVTTVEGYYTLVSNPGIIPCLEENLNTENDPNCLKARESVNKKQPGKMPPQKCRDLSSDERYRQIKFVCTNAETSSATPGMVGQQNMFPGAVYMMDPPMAMENQPVLYQPMQDYSVQSPPVLYPLVQNLPMQNPYLPVAQMPYANAFGSSSPMV